MAGAGYKSWVDGDILTAADVNTYLMQQAVMVFDDASARTTALPTPSEGMVSFLKDTNEIAVYDGSAWVVYAGRGYQYVQTVYFTSSGNFTKATYPWLRAVNVKVQGGGGGAAGAATTSASQVSMGSGGGGGSYAESFIIASSLSATETVTIGAGGAGGSGAAGTSGGASSFGSLVSASGGFNGLLRSASTPPTLIVANGNPATVTGDLTNGGTAGTYGVGLNNTFVNGGTGGPSVLGAGGRGSTFAEDGEAGRGYGGGGGGGANAQNQATARTGGSGSAGIVIVELYA